MIDDELEAFIDRAFDDYLNKFILSNDFPDYIQRDPLKRSEKNRYFKIAKHLMEFTDKEMKNDTTN